jgi:hypothetical protein
VIVLTIPLSGCETAKSWLQGWRTEEPTEPVILRAPEANGYLTELYRLADGDPATQAEIYADAESEATLTPSTQSELRFALILASAGHPGGDPVKAQSLLRELLAQPELMTSTEISMATIFLKDVEARIVLNNETRRLRTEYQQAASIEEAATTRRISQIENNNRQLREALAEAEAKLEAITSIERSIREQSGENEPR